MRAYDVLVYAWYKMEQEQQLTLDSKWYMVGLATGSTPNVYGAPGSPSPSSPGGATCTSEGMYGSPRRGLLQPSLPRGRGAAGLACPTW